MPSRLQPHLPRHEHAEPGGEPEALRMAQRLGCYLGRRVAAVMATKGEQWWQATLEVEFGGIGEAAYRLHVLSLARGAARNATAAADALDLARAFHRRAFIEPLQQGRDGLRNLHANTHLPTLVAAARGAEVDGGEGGEGGKGGGGNAAALLTTALNAYCLLQLGYAYAGSGGSSVNEHWQHQAAATGGASRTVFAAAELEDISMDCARLVDAGECGRAQSQAYMYAHCAASCDDHDRAATQAAATPQATATATATASAPCARQRRA